MHYSLWVALPIEYLESGHSSLEMAVGNRIEEYWLEYDGAEPWRNYDDPAEWPEEIEEDNGKFYLWGEQVFEDDEGDKYVLSTRTRQGEYDWYVIGGRWTGIFEPSYNPREDIRNLSTCPYCGGRGLRHWEREESSVLIASVCNACRGSGAHVAYQLANTEHNYSATNAVKPGVPMPFAVVDEHGSWCHNDAGEEVVEEYRDREDLMWVIVDCHC